MDGIQKPPQLPNNIRSAKQYVPKPPPPEEAEFLDGKNRIKGYVVIAALAFAILCIGGGTVAYIAGWMPEVIEENIANIKLQALKAMVLYRPSMDNF